MYLLYCNLFSYLFEGKGLYRSHKTVSKQVLFFCRSTPAIPRDLDSRTSITIGEKTFSIEADDLESICVLGRGAYGVVEKVKHKQTGTVLAVKVHHHIRNTGQMCSWPQYQTSLINNYVLMDHSLIVGCRGVLTYNKGFVYYQRVKNEKIIMLNVHSGD